MTTAPLTTGRLLATRSRTALTRLTQPLPGAAAVVRPVVTALTPLGRTVLLLGVLAWAGASLLGWQELRLTATCCVAAVGLALPWVLSRARLSVTLDVHPERLTAGEAGIGTLTVVNRRGRPVRGHDVEVPVGEGTVSVHLPPLGPSASTEEAFVITTSRRGLLVLGPAAAVRADPLALLRREVSWPDRRILIVHPQRVPVPEITSGWARDLEGRETDDLTASGVAFHALRDYVSGDDRRHIHWRTTARTGRYVVRQFVDIRRSSVGVLLGTSPEEYAHPDDFELAVSVAASLAESALRQGQDVVVAAGGSLLPAHSPAALLDALAGLDADGGSLLSAVARGRSRLVAAGLVVLVTGQGVEATQLGAAARRLPGGARLLGVRAAMTATPGLARSGQLPLLDIAALSDLPRLTRRGLAA